MGSVMRITLHEAMEIVLKDKQSKQERAEVLAEEIERRNLYQKKRGSRRLTPQQIVLRALKYPEKFEVIVKLKEDPEHF